MGRWRFALVILFGAVLLAGAMGAADRARAQSDAELKALNDQVIALHRVGKSADAIPLAERYAEALKTRPGANHSEYAAALSNLAELLRTTNRLAEAEPLMRRALVINEKRTRRASGPSIQRSPFASTIWPCCCRKPIG